MRQHRTQNSQRKLVFRDKEEIQLKQRKELVLRRAIKLKLLQNKCFLQRIKFSVSKLSNCHTAQITMLNKSRTLFHENQTKRRGFTLEIQITDLEVKEDHQAVEWEIYLRQIGLNLEVEDLEHSKISTFHLET